MWELSPAAWRTEGSRYPWSPLSHPGSPGTVDSPVWPLSEVGQGPASPVTNYSWIYFAGSCHRLWWSGRDRQKLRWARVSKHPPSLPTPRNQSQPHPPRPPTPAGTSGPEPPSPQDQGDDEQQGAEGQAEGHGQNPSLKGRRQDQRAAWEDRERRVSPMCLLLLGHCDPRPGPPEPLGGGGHPEERWALCFCPSWPCGHSTKSRRGARREGPGGQLLAS